LPPVSFKHCIVATEIQKSKHEYKRSLDSQPISCSILAPRARKCWAISAPHCSDTPLIMQSTNSGGLQPHRITTDIRSKYSGRL